MNAIARHSDLIDGNDYGPTVMLRRGDIEREERADGQRTVLGGRRKDGLRTMLMRGQITGAQWNGADKYRTDLAIASGASDRTPGGARGNPGYGPTERQLDAQTRVRGATQAVGLIHAGITSWVIVSGGTIAGYAEGKRIGKETASLWLYAALDRLADFYSGGR